MTFKWTLTKEEIRQFVGFMIALLAGFAAGVTLFSPTPPMILSILNFLLKAVEAVMMVVAFLVAFIIANKACSD